MQGATLPHGPKSSHGGFRRTWSGRSTRGGNRRPCSDCGELRKELEAIKKKLENIPLAAPTTAPGNQQAPMPKVPKPLDVEEVRLINESAYPHRKRQISMLKKEQTRAQREETTSLVGTARRAQGEGRSGESMIRSVSQATLLSTSRSRRTSEKKKLPRPVHSMKKSVPSAASAPPAAPVPVTTPPVQLVSSETAIDAAKTKDLKRRAGYRSDPTRLTTIVESRAETAIDDMADKPVLRDVVSVKEKGTKLTFCERRVARNKPVLVLDDLYWFLCLEFAFVPRTSDLLRQMRAKAKQFLTMHDTSGLTLQVQYQLVLTTITKCMDVPHEEQMARQALKNPVANEERVKQQKMTATGEVGKSGWGVFGTTHKLPKQKV